MPPPCSCTAAGATGTARRAARVLPLPMLGPACETPGSRVRLCWFQSLPPGHDRVRRPLPQARQRGPSRLPSSRSEGARSWLATGTHDVAALLTALRRGGVQRRAREWGQASCEDGERRYVRKAEEGNGGGGRKHEAMVTSGEEGRGRCAAGSVAGARATPEALGSGPKRGCRRRFWRPSRFARWEQRGSRFKEAERGRGHVAKD